MSQENVNHPKHYNAHPAGIECIDVVEHMSFNLGNAIKYLWRAGMKGDFEEDCRKAIWYVEREIERKKRERHRLAKEAIVQAGLEGRQSWDEAEVLFELEDRRERERRDQEQGGA